MIPPYDNWICPKFLIMFAPQNGWIHGSAVPVYNRLYIVDVFCFIYIVWAMHWPSRMISNVCVVCLFEIQKLEHVTSS